jgi:DNA-binding MarR family transcriptional regulator
MTGKGPDAAVLNDSPLCLCDTLRMTARAVTAVYDDTLRPLGLRVTQFSLLARAASMGPVESWRLSEALGLDKTTLPRNLRPLERRGLIAIAPGEDRRTRLVRVTPAGKKLLKEAVTRWRSVQASFKERLHDDEFDRTLRQLLRVRAAARA